MTSPYRPPSCDLPPEHYDEFRGMKPCPICDLDEFGWDIDTICFEEFSNDEVVVQCGGCGFQVNDRTHRESKGAAVKEWNSIPRRSEVAELLRLVEEVTQYPMYGPLTATFDALREYADRLRKEWKL